MNERTPDLRAALALLASFIAVIAASLCQPGMAAPLPSERPALLAQAVGQGEKVSPPGKAGAKAQAATSRKITVNERGGLDYVDVLCAAPAFEQSVRDSLRGMKFAPAQGKDGPVKSYLWVEFAYGRGFPCPSVPD
jgi:hypothetical protein